MVHELKTWPFYFSAVWDGRKTFELRKTDDRHFKEGDELVLREYNPMGGYTGRKICCTVGFVMGGGNFGLPANLCVISLLDIRQLGVDELAKELAHADP
jgi:hypothetical protein